jgi:hypothetical protein
MFSTLICIFTLDRIGRRWTLYLGAVGLIVKAAGDDSTAAAYGAAAAAFVFGAARLTVP